MVRTLDLFEQVSDVVQVETGRKRPEISRVDDEALPRRGRARLLQPAPKRVIDDLAKRPSGLPGLGFQLGGDVVVQSEGRAHILMLTIEHHDVNAGPSPISPKT